MKKFTFEGHGERSKTESNHQLSALKSWFDFAHHVPLRRHLIFFFILLFFFTCSTFAGSNPSYKDILKKHHRHGEFFNKQNLHANIVWDVIYKSEEFREAYEREYAKIYHLSESELQSRIREEQEEARDGDEFVVILYTYDKKWNDLESAQTSWRVRLAVGNEEYEPVNITKVKPNPVNQTFYPFMEPWTKTYSVFFAPGSIPKNPQNFKLTLFGVKGEQTLAWNLSK
jgi:hypothetical protein